MRALASPRSLPHEKARITGFPRLNMLSERCQTQHGLLRVAAKLAQLPAARSSAVVGSPRLGSTVLQKHVPLWGRGGSTSNCLPACICL